MKALRNVCGVWAVVAFAACVSSLWLTAGQSPSKGRKADNDRCLVCHLNYKEEELAARHARANIGCVKCHGESLPHSSDEENVTAPDTMIPAPQINSFCMTCHPREKLSHTHKPLFSGAETKLKYCTDCHGRHRLAYRTRRWDKTSGKLLSKE